MRPSAEHAGAVAELVRQHPSLGDAIRVHLAALAGDGDGFGPDDTVAPRESMELPRFIANEVCAVFYGQDAQPDPAPAIAALCRRHVAYATDIRGLAASLQAQCDDLRRRLDSVRRLSRQVDRYEPIEDLACGGFGAVAIVRDRLLGRRVALKTIHPRHGRRLGEIDPVVVHRFLDEAQIAGQLHHPGIPPVHDVGLGPSGAPYYTMRFVEGHTLAELLDPVGGGCAGSLSDGVRLLARVAEAVAYAHGRNVLHRDLKPANIVVGRFGEVSVIDWGLARAPEQGRAGAVDPRASVRTDREIDLFSGGMGSEGFMAPEQRHGGFDLASDVFSLAAILHVMLVGKPPVLDGGRHYRVPGGGRDRRLAAICARGLAPFVSDRYPTVGGLLADLRAYLAPRFVAGLWARWSARRRPGAASLPLANATRPNRHAGVGAARGAAEHQLTHVTAFPAGKYAADAADGRARSVDAITWRLQTITDLSTSADRYRGVEVLSEGGMGSVSLMRDDLLHRPVAVKTLRAHLREEERFLQMLLDEAQITAQLDHPAVSTVHEIGIDASGTVRIVMPKLNGGTLEARLRRGGEWVESARLLLQAAWGLAYAHRKGVVHRDVKPRNILLGEHGDAYMGDWGLALLLGAARKGESRVRIQRGPDVLDTIEENETENAGSIAGTPLYMAPETCGFDLGPIGPHTDVWSLGLVLFEIVVGRHPFKDSCKGMASDEILNLGRRRCLPRVRDWDPRAPRPVAAVIDRAVQHDPERRFRDASEFSRALERTFHGQM